MEAVVVSKDTIIVSPQNASIVKMYSDGFKAADISKKLKISTRTVEKHIENLKYSFECKTVTQLVAEFLRKGLIQ